MSTTIDLHLLKQLLQRCLDQCGREWGRYIDLDADYWLLELSNAFVLDAKRVSTPGIRRHSGSGVSIGEPKTRTAVDPSHWTAAPSRRCASIAAASSRNGSWSAPPSPMPGWPSAGPTVTAYGPMR